MDIAIKEAEAQLTDLVNKAVAGEDVVLTRQGQALVRLVPVTPPLTKAQQHALTLEIIAEARANPVSGPNSVRSQDFLYGDDGLPA
ncbi:type II toxin-antitoxin system Phd/YefM family antitoxin [Nitrospirillum amazonense]|uniref:Prevent-host-death family protein n=1 Tax=Nitrospirillum amazonense TaxID=28077 RepID=A0A560JSA5_9PROT|nr:type II toxin-antitoxin system prevent-host-death family antitoxin [Nitrospirillum amazonense]MDG3441994.1 type II toxin-antitoxin system prevent-host-death family antitoxin [Nitrospirillum amazonense]TWB73509.1 prevent-host-death family protein [Nitrospirillum amazonense]